MSGLSKAAAALGRKGGKAKVKKGFAMLPVERRREIQAAGVAARKAEREEKEKQ